MIIYDLFEQYCSRAFPQLGRVDEPGWREFTDAGVSLTE